MLINNHRNGGVAPIVIKFIGITKIIMVCFRQYLCYLPWFCLTSVPLSTCLFQTSAAIDGMKVVTLTEKNNNNTQLKNISKYTYY